MHPRPNAHGAAVGLPVIDRCTLGRKKTHGSAVGVRGTSSGLMNRNGRASVRERDWTWVYLTPTCLRTSATIRSSTSAPQLAGNP